MVVRGALFPVALLDQLIDEDLTRLTTADGPSYRTAYETSMRRQRQVLGAVTLEDPAFLRAVCLTNEELGHRIVTTPSRLGGPNKRGRRLEATLYRYLARAVWRTEPCDLWAGMGIATWGTGDRWSPVPAGYAVSPDLRPFQFIVQSLARTAAYVEPGLFKLNPTLTFDRERRCWCYTVRSFSSIISQERASSPGLDALLDVLQHLEPATLREVADGARQRGFTDHNIDRVVTALHARGMLVGGLTFPARYATSWEALSLAQRDLREGHASVWQSSVERLQETCLDLERRLETISVPELLGILRAARAVPVALAGALGVAEPPLARSFLRCDTRLPYSIVLGEATRERLSGASAEYDEYERWRGLDAAIRVAHRRSLLEPTVAARPRALHEPGPIATQEAAWRAAGSDPVVGGRLAELSGRRAHAEPTGYSARDQAAGYGASPIEVALPPIGALVLRPAGRHDRIVGSTTEVGAAYGRYGCLWPGPAPASPFDLLHRWYTSALSKAGAAAGVEIIEYAGPCEALPNLLCRPDFGLRTWDRWRTESSFQDDQLRIAPVLGTSVGLVSREGVPGRAAIACFSPANVGFSEPDLERLLLSSFREVPTCLSQALPMASELELGVPSDPVTLPSGNAIRLRRTFVHGARLAELVAADRPQRYLLWHVMAREFCWPPLVLVGIDGGAPLLVVRDSPLAVEAVLRGIGPGTRMMCVEEQQDEARQVGEKGQRYVVEFIVPFVRRRHAWLPLAAGERRAAE